MKRKLFRLLACSIGILLILAMPITSFADEGDLYGKLSNAGDLFSPTKTIEEQLLELPESKRAEALEKYYKSEFIDANDISNANCNRDTTWSHLFGITAYYQETNYYCVPASCKTAMQYLTGTSSSQSTIASALGTTTGGTPFGNARTYLNNNQNVCVYVSKGVNTNITTMKNDFYNSVVFFDDPPLISVEFYTTSGWDYDTDGHTMCIGSARNDKEYFKLLDSFIQWKVPNASMYYSKSASDIHSAISAHGNGYIY